MNACPACRARFSGSPHCRRCGTDLSRVFAVLLAAREAREEARRALVAGDGDRALAAVRRALRLEDVPRARRLEVLALLATGALRPAVHRLLRHDIWDI